MCVFASEEGTRCLVGACSAVCLGCLPGLGGCGGQEPLYSRAASARRRGRPKIAAGEPVMAKRGANRWELLRQRGAFDILGVRKVRFDIWGVNR